MLITEDNLMDEILEQLIIEHKSLLANEERLRENCAAQKEFDDNDLKLIKSFRKLIRHIDEHYNVSTDDLDKILFDNIDDVYDILGCK